MSRMRAWSVWCCSADIPVSVGLLCSSRVFCASVSLRTAPPGTMPLPPGCCASHPTLRQLPSSMPCEPVCAHTAGATHKAQSMVQNIDNLQLLQDVMTGQKGMTLHPPTHRPAGISHKQARCIKPAASAVGLCLASCCWRQQAGWDRHTTPASAATAQYSHRSSPCSLCAQVSAHAASGDF